MNKVNERKEFFKLPLAAELQRFAHLRVNTLIPELVHSPQGVKPILVKAQVSTMNWLPPCPMLCIGPAVSREDIAVKQWCCPHKAS